MRRLTVFTVSVSVLLASGYVAAQGRVYQQGRAIVEYRSPEVTAVAAYEYSQRHHDGAWLLIELAVQATKRIALHRDQISLVGADEERIPVATQQQFLEDHEELNKLLQNAVVT